MNSNLQIGAAYQVRIDRILSFGLLVSLENGQNGLIRAREICWEDLGKSDWSRRYAVKHQCEAKLIGWEGETPLLSLRFAQRDPWETAGVRYRLGKIYTGIVSGFDGPRAFIDLEPGITGCLQRTKLPIWNNAPVEELLWLGDQVRVLVEQVYYARREIELTMHGLEKVRWPTADVESEPQAIRRQFAPPSPTPALPLFSSPTPRSLLVVEDDISQNQALSGWLRSIGHTVESALGESEARAALEQRTVEAILSDVRLEDGDGIRFVAEMMGRYPDSRWILMTDWSTAKDRDEEVRSLENRGAVLLLKPALPEDIQQVLDDVSCVEQVEGKGGAVIEQADIREAREQLRKRRNPASHSAHVQQVLEQLRRTTRAGRVILFRLHAYQRQIDIAGDTGRANLNMNALGALIHSPVREVLDEQATVQVTDVQNAKRYIRNLSPLLHFRSCVGVPILAGTEEKYALFLFHNEPGFVGDAIVQDAANAALALAAHLEQQTALAQMLEVQRASLAGDLARGMVHEVNHHLGPIVWVLPQMQDASTRLQQEIDHLLDSPHRVTNGNGNPLPNMRWDLQKLQRDLSAVTVGVNNLVQTTHLFGRITVQDTEQLLRVERVVEICLELVRDMADRAKVKLSFTPSERLHLTRARESQIQQILLNLLINAVQQISRIRPTQGGQIVMTVTPGEEGERTIQITVEDDGPGIHRRLWDPIFRLGMTTRQGEGSGMGLFIAERLAQDLGGSVQVDESFVGWGSRFVVELPVQS